MRGSLSAEGIPANISVSSSTDHGGPVGLGQGHGADLRARRAGEDGLEEGVHGPMLPTGKSALPTARGAHGRSEKRWAGVAVLSPCTGAARSPAVVAGATPYTWGQSYSPWRSVMAGSVIVAGARTPIGKLSGALAGFTAMDLGGLAIKAALARAGVSPADVDYVFMGQVIQAGQGQITSRQAAVKAGIPMSVLRRTLCRATASLPGPTHGLL